ncbi:Tetratricopeptide repeat-containing protein [Chitinophaga jiangningensis]|uniref:Tetratricopeptide repeat-containing protein n=1 Tax=Chitinophaga jiangningensis TaxID=1419482 RepID=A0A1M7MKU7_9BACT|nr:tetratricopeptide repeat protein [Chitinophaga jiangningensis]SHM91071.1 Tetratricopeptide repeat-containing protein [Chitinophaga jiangningensis]
MAMHEIETLVETSILCLDNSQDELADYRSLIFNLYQLQDSFDTGFTHFRVMDILIKHRYVYTFPITAHPAYLEHTAFFDGLAASQKFSFIYANPAKEWDATANPVAGYANYDHATGKYILYCDAGSLLWSAMVAAGTITGKDALAPEPMGFFHLALTITEFAAAQQDKDLLGLWYLLLPYMVMQAEQDGIPIQTKDLETIFNIIVNQDAIPHEGLPYIEDIPKGGELGAFCEWWYAPAKEWMPTEPEAAEEIDLEAIPFTQEVEKSAHWYSQQVVTLMETATNAIQQMEENGGDEATQQAIQQQLAAALTYANKGLEIAPGEPNLLMNKGSILMLLQDYPAAMACYDEALTAAPTNPYVHLNRAILFYHMDQFQESKASFEKLLQLEPSNEFAQQWLQHLREEGY